MPSTAINKNQICKSSKGGNAQTQPKKNKRLRHNAKKIGARQSQICTYFFAPFGTYSVSFCFFYHPCYEKHINFYLLCQFSTFLSQPLVQPFAVVVLVSQALQQPFRLLPTSVGFVGVFSLGRLLWVAVFILWLVVASFGCMLRVSVSFRLCPFRALMKL